MVMTFPLENHRAIGFLCNTDGRLTSYIAIIQYKWVIIGPPEKRHLNGVCLAGDNDPSFLPDR